MRYKLSSVSKPRVPFTFKDLEQECRISHCDYRVNDRESDDCFGIKVWVPSVLFDRFPYNCSAYDFLQFLRNEILQYGTIEFPSLPVNLSNHTVAMRAPEQHTYSSNPYLTDHCQALHQDTPPYPSAFWLGETRCYSATWVVGLKGLYRFKEFAAANPELSMNDIHLALVKESLKDEWGILLNYYPGLLLMDNSDHHHLYHGRTCFFDQRKQAMGSITDAPMYAYNEIGLLNYIDSLDERRGMEYRDEDEKQAVLKFMDQEAFSKRFNKMPT